MPETCPFTGIHPRRLRPITMWGEESSEKIVSRGLPDRDGAIRFHEPAPQATSLS